MAAGGRQEGHEGPCPSPGVAEGEGPTPAREVLALPAAMLGPLDVLGVTNEMNALPRGSKDGWEPPRRARGRSSDGGA